ncbi:MAG: DUF4258 domain-containing protein [Deltaproteobacteria bacterium]|nr:DUF4258 domain-containing protein [Deltaproteobacteria bacterium]
MRIFKWDEQKNDWLKRERGISFEQVVFCIEEGKLLDIVRHPNRKKYKGQRLYILDIDGYAFVVPYVESEECIFLQTVFPSRRFTGIYLRQGG